MVITLLQSLTLALVGVFAPGSITLVILLLMSEYSWRNGVAFASGYIIMYSLIGSGMLVLGVGVVGNSQPEQTLTTSYLLIGLSMVLFALTIRNWLRQPPTATQTDAPSRFASMIDGITPFKAFGLAAIISLINVKNLTIFLSAVSVLLLSDLLLATQLMMLIPLVLVFCTSVLIPIAIYLLFPDQANDNLNRMKAAISRYSRPLGIAVTLILGVLFLYRGLTGFY